MCKTIEMKKEEGPWLKKLLNNIIIQNVISVILKFIILKKMFIINWRTSINLFKTYT
jgi:hypothetical protein